MINRAPTEIKEADVAKILTENQQADLPGALIGKITLKSGEIRNISACDCLNLIDNPHNVQHIALFYFRCYESSDFELSRYSSSENIDDLSHVQLFDFDLEKGKKKSFLNLNTIKLLCDALEPQYASNINRLPHLLSCQRKIMKMILEGSVSFFDQLRDYPTWFLCFQRNHNKLSALRIKEPSIPELPPKLDLSSTETYTQETFSDLIHAAFCKGLPYFVVLTKDKCGNRQYFDAYSFLLGSYKYGNRESPLTRSEITDRQLYRICLEGKVEDMGSLNEGLTSELDQILTATSLFAPEKKCGEARMLLGFKYYEESLKDTLDSEKAIFWLKLAAEKDKIKSCKLLVEMYRNNTKLLDVHEAAYYSHKYRFLELKKKALRPKKTKSSVKRKLFI